MQHTSCEQITWKLLPAIRKEIARTMITKFGLTQRDAAKKLGVTPAAICQYLSQKRGHVDIKNQKIQQEILISTQKIIHFEKQVVFETCRLCRLVQKETQIKH